MLSDLAMIPIEYDKEGMVVNVNATEFCSNTSSAPNILTPVLSRSSTVCINYLHSLLNPDSYDYA